MDAHSLYTASNDSTASPIKTDTESPLMLKHTHSHTVMRDELPLFAYTVSTAQKRLLAFMYCFNMLCQNNLFFTFNVQGQLLVS